MEPKFLPHFEKPEIETPSFPEEMYAVSGFLSPNSKHYEKSQKFNEDIDALTQQITPLREILWGDTDAYTKVSQAFDSSIESIQLVATYAVHSLEQDQEVELFKKNISLLLNNQNLLNAVSEDICDSYLTGEASDFFVHAALSSDIPTSAKIELVQNLYESSSILQTLADTSLSDEIIAAAIHQLSKLPKETQVHTIEKFITSNSERVQAAVIEELRHLPPRSNRPSIIREALHSASPTLQTAALTQIEYLPPQERRTFIEQALRSSDETMRSIAIDHMIGHYPKEEIVKHIKSAFHSESYLLQKKALEHIDILDAEEQRRFAEHVFALHNEDLIITLSTQISSLNPNYGIRRQIIEQGLMLPATGLQWFFAHQIKHLPEEERLQMLQDKRFTEALIASPLYKNSTLSPESFGRESFEKSGSKTTLLGGALKNKLILRHLEPDTFVAWQKAFEAHTTWKELGFDYVPIEPIQSYRLSQSGFVDVASGVLDIDYGHWRGRFPTLFTNSLKEQKNAILKGLQVLGVNHGHSHGNNFVLRFFRNEDDLPDLTRTPRLYIIDFDSAKSVDNKS